MPAMKSAVQGGRRREKTHHACRLGASQLGALVHLAVDQPDVPDHLVFGILVQLGSWQAPFIVAAALLVIGAGIWAFWLDPDVSVIE